MDSRIGGSALQIEHIFIGTIRECSTEKINGTLAGLALTPRFAFGLSRTYCKLGLRRASELPCPMAILARKKFRAWTPPRKDSRPRISTPNHFKSLHAISRIHSTAIAPASHYPTVRVVPRVRQVAQS